MTTTEQSKRKTLIQEGFCLFEQVLDAGVIDRVAAASDRLLDAQEAEHFARNRSSGSMASIFDDPAYAELIAWPAALEAPSVATTDGGESVANCRPTNVFASCETATCSHAGETSPSVCSDCGGPMRVLAALTDLNSIHSYLEGVGLASRASPIAPARPSPQPEFDYVS